MPFANALTPGLRDRQEKTSRYLATKMLKSLTPMAGYAPHITLARVRHAKSDPLLGAAFRNHVMPVRPILGLSTENGLLTQEL